MLCFVFPVESSNAGLPDSKLAPRQPQPFQEGMNEYLFSFCSWKAATVIFWSHTPAEADYNPLSEKWGNPRKPAKTTLQMSKSMAVASGGRYQKWSPT